jgi:hypothetical protein
VAVDMAPNPVGPATTMIVINAGTFAPASNDLIHELTHAWQSQHSINPKQFMVNSVESQGIAGALNLLGADASAYYGFYSFGCLAALQQKGIDCVMRLHQAPPGRFAARQALGQS